MNELVLTTLDLLSNPFIGVLIRFASLVAGLLSWISAFHLFIF